MITTFRSQENDEQLSILDYDVSKTNVRYKAVINDDQVAVLHVQRLGKLDTNLSLCPGMLESRLQQIISSPCLLLIEKAEDEIVYRSRNCQMLLDQNISGQLCSACQEIFSDQKTSNNVIIKFKKQEQNIDENGDDYFDYPEVKMDEPEVKFEDIEKDEEDAMETFEENSFNTIVSKFYELTSSHDSNTGNENMDKIQESMPNKKTFQKQSREKEVPEPHSKCPFCDKSFPPLSPSFIDHVKIFHSGESENPLYIDILAKTTVRKYICDCCGKELTSHKTLENHMIDFHDSQLNTVNCDICGKLFKNKQNLRFHVRCAHETPEKKHLCIECGKCFLTKALLSQHMLRSHSKVEFPCSKCEKKFKIKSDLVRHFKIKHTERERLHNCVECGRDFYQRQQLLLHIACVHKKLKPFYCEICDFKCARLNNLNLHRRKSHEKPSITKNTLLEMVKNDQHPFYTKDDITMIENGFH